MTDTHALSVGENITTKIDVTPPPATSKPNGEPEYSEEAKTIKDSYWRQMKCETTTLTYGKFWVQCIYLAVAIIFIPIGIICHSVSEGVVEQHFDAYSSRDECKISDTFKKNASWGITCNVSYEVEHDFKSPIYFYYKVKSMYQNHRNYVKSRTDAQLTGSTTDVSDCSPMQKYNGSKLLACGLISYSFFNDKYKVTHIDGDTGNTTELCDEPTTCNGDERTTSWTNASWHSEPNWSKSGISWKSDRDEKFKSTKLNSKTTRQGKLQHWQGVTLPDTDDEDFIVWMRTSTADEFIKLHRIIRDKEFKKGDTLNITINNWFEVNSFGGKKSLVISGTSALGGQNQPLGIAFMVMGGISLLTAVFFCVFFHSSSEMPYASDE